MINFSYTKYKVILASLLYKFLRIFFKDDNIIISRKGIKYQIDLSEGIDLSLFLFGSFQDYTVSGHNISIPQDAVILDVGANIGAMSLSYAKNYPCSQVYSFEPAHISYTKLCRNITLNPQLQNRITPLNVFISDKNSTNYKDRVFSSWSLKNTNNERHSVHLGIEISSSGIPAITLDSFVEDTNLEKVDLIKIDTDGNELEVLKGAENIIRKFRPSIIFEIGGYLLQERGIEFKEYYELFKKLNYSVVEIKHNTTVTLDNANDVIPSKSTVDLLAFPL
jgi:FkbM family methyltransferase